MTETASINEWTLDECNDRLVDYRQKRIRNSEIVNNIAKRIFTLNSNWSKIKDKHAALEQCCMASIDCGDGAFAGRIFKLIEHDFPRDSSRRAERLYLMFFENSQIDDVINNRDDIIEKHPTDQIVLKRDITTLMDHGDIEGAIKELCRHLETYQCDEDSWACLADLYIDQGQYEKASFCVEELVMKNPYTSHYHIRLAEIYYTWACLDQGNQSQLQILENYNSAKFHYAHAVRLTMKQPQGSNMRALFGWMQTSKALNSLRNNRKDQDAIEDEKKIVSFTEQQMSKTNMQNFKQGEQTEEYVTKMMEELKV